MDKNYFDIFTKMVINTYYDVVVLDVENLMTYVLKLGRKPELEGKEFPAMEILDYLFSQGASQEADKYIITGVWGTIRSRCEKHESGLVFNHRTLIHGQKRWLNVYMYVPECYGIDDTKVVFYSKLLSEEEALKHEIMMGVERGLYKIGKIYLNEDRIESLSISYNEKVSMKHFDGSGFSAEVKYIAENMIHPDDKEKYLDFLNPKKIEKYHRDGYRNYGFMCRRRSRKVYDWVFIKIDPTLDYKPDNMIFTIHVVEINSSVVNYVNDALKGISGEEKGLGNLSYGFTRYFDRIKVALGAFTYQFASFIEIELSSNHYISFKPEFGTNKALFSDEGDYLEDSLKVIEKLYEGEEAEKLRGFINLKNVSQQLVTNSAISDNFRRKTGELMKVTFAKTESIKGTPTIVNVTSEFLNEKTNQLKVVTFGNFEVYDSEGNPVYFEKKQSKQVLAYLIDKVGYPISNEDVITDVLEKPIDDLNARKYASALIRKAMKDLENAGYPDVIIKESSQTRINKDAVDCDYYHLLDGNIFYWRLYHNEYMKEYSWAEETNSEITHYFDK